MRKPIHVLDYTWLSYYIFMHLTEGLWSDSLFPTLYKWGVSFGYLRKISLVVSFYLWFWLDVLCQVNVYKVWGVGFFFVSLRINPFSFHFHSLSFYSITMVGSAHFLFFSFFQCRRRTLTMQRLLPLSLASMTMLEHEIFFSGWSPPPSLRFWKSLMSHNT